MSDIFFGILCGVLFCIVLGFGAAGMFDTGRANVINECRQQGVHTFNGKVYECHFQEKNR